MEKKRNQGRGAGHTGKGLAREYLTEKMTFETSLGASWQVSEEIVSGKETAGSRNSK